ncbi:hypothetical protein DFJ63DRAFT_316088 [Scheffersomyces coipomensis]|uniref:uncharacterized protein n=1 Tax=Scheffersomyces coipomensis TaxID=1788519 RepID=UPI00315CAD94
MISNIPNEADEQESIVTKKETPIQDWFSYDEYEDMPDVDLRPNVSVFNRRMYTISDTGGLYHKFKTVNKLIKSQDELCHLDTNAFFFFFKFVIYSYSKIL